MTQPSRKVGIMGRGDQRTKRGKVARGTRGKSRPKHGGRKARVDAAKKAAATPPPAKA